MSRTISPFPANLSHRRRDIFSGQPRLLPHAPRSVHEGSELRERGWCEVSEDHHVAFGDHNELRAHFQPQPTPNGLGVKNEEVVHRG